MGHQWRILVRLGHHEEKTPSRPSNPDRPPTAAQIGHGPPILEIEANLVVIRRPNTPADGPSWLEIQ